MSSLKTASTGFKEIKMCRVLGNARLNLRCINFCFHFVQEDNQVLAHFKDFASQKQKSFKTQRELYYTTVSFKGHVSSIESLSILRASINIF